MSRRDAATSTSTVPVRRLASVVFCSISSRISSFAVMLLPTTANILLSPIAATRKACRGSNSSREISGSMSDTSPSISRIDRCVCPCKGSRSLPFETAAARIISSKTTPASRRIASSDNKSTIACWNCSRAWRRCSTDDSGKVIVRCSPSTLVRRSLKRGRQIVSNCW